MPTERVANILDRPGGLRLGREGRKVAAGVALIGLILFGQSLVGAATASSRLDPALHNPTGSSNVIAVLDFTPERFHNERLARYGVFSGRDGGVGRVRLRMVTPENLNRLAKLAWVSRIEPMPTAARPAPPRPAQPALAAPGAQPASSKP